MGASNLERGLRPALGLAFQRLGGPLEVFVASGFGRSYGQSSLVLGRRLPGLLDCGLWPALQRREAEPTAPGLQAAVLLDVGNDLLYGASVATLLGWVERCLERLREQGARLVLAGLPLPALSGLSRSRFLFVRTLLYPRSPLTYAALERDAPRVQAGLQALAARFSAAFVEWPGALYGLDPVHFRWDLRKAAFARLFAPLPEHGEAAVEAAGLPWNLSLCGPERRALLGLGLHRPQPRFTWPDGSSLSFY